MTTTTLKKHISYVTDSAGQKVAVQIDIKSKQMKDFFEDLFDTLDAIERQDEQGRPFDEYVKEYLSKQKASACVIRF
jgi:hypothetical protein